LGHFFLEGEIGGVAAKEVFFIHTNGGEVGGGGRAAPGMGKEEDLAAAAQKRLGLEKGGIRWNGNNGGIETAFPGEALEAVGEVRGIGGESPFGAPLAGELESFGQEIAGDDLEAAQGQQAGEQQTNRPLTGDEDDVTAQQNESFHGFEHGIDRFLHGAFEAGIARGDFNDAREDEVHDADIFGVAATGRFKAGGDASALVLGALGKGAMAAGVAIQAGDVMVEGGAGAEAKAAGLRAHLDNDAGGFMAEDARGREGGVLDFFDVGGADAAGGDLNEEFAGADFGDGNGFEAEIVGAAIHDGGHGFRDGHGVF